MPETSFTQVRDLQDKTTLKGIYFFLSLSISLLLFKIGGFQSVSFFNPLENIAEYISIISLASLLGAFFYYTQPNLYLLKLIIRLKDISSEYPEYGDVTIYNSIDHLFIRKERTRFGSKLFFNFTLIIILFLFFGESYEILIIALMLIIIAIMILFYLLLKEWSDLILRLKLIYFMKLFCQENNPYYHKEITTFINYLGKELWFEGKSSLAQFINGHLKFISEPYIQKLKHSNILEKFYNFIYSFWDNREINIKKAAHEITEWFFNTMNLEMSIGFNKLDRYTLDYINPIKEALEYFKKFSEEIQNWDKWLKKCVFNLEEIDLEQLLSQMENELKLINKNNEYGKLEAKQKQLSQGEIKVDQILRLQEEIYIQYRKIIHQLSEESEVLKLLNIKNFFKEDLFKEYLKKIRDKIYFFETDLKLVKRLSKENYQKVFSSICEILKFYLETRIYQDFLYLAIEIILL